ncbi:MAG TPA: response regulator, partial [Acidobacteriota bacterium]|nr:response regulator [Acidobacteriota bacterium]
MNNVGEASILVVDDNEDNRDMLSRRLKRQGYRVAAAENGFQALEMVSAEKFDLVVLDIMMPGISGLEVLKMLRQTYSVADLPVIMATAKDQSEDVVIALGMGANDYVTKPLDFPVALARIQSQLALKRLSGLKDEFLRIASHDLKNPLTVVLGTVKMVQRHVPPGTLMTADSYDMLSKITKRALEIQRIIEDFLDFQALQDGQLNLVKAPTDLNEIARDACESNQEYAAGKEITLELDLATDLPLIDADAARLTQVVRNFTSNAVKFGTFGSSALVRTRKDDSFVRLEVTDSGPGLTEEDLKKTFRKYARLSNKPTGGEKSSGLGLAICKQMIDLHGGEIGVHNNPDKGATF